MTFPDRLSDWKLWLLGVVASLLIVAAMAPAKAAACNSPIATKAGDGSIACVTTSPSPIGPVLDYCDHDSDGHKVYARFSDSVITGRGYWTSTPNVPIADAYDPNGASSGCGHLHLLNGRFYAWAVCVQNEGCSGWAMYSPPAPTIPVRLPRLL